MISGVAVRPFPVAAGPGRASLGGVSGPSSLRRVLAVAVTAAGATTLVAAALLTGGDDAVAPTQVAQVVPLPGPVAPGRPALTGPPFRGAPVTTAPSAPTAPSGPTPPATRSGFPAPAPPVPLPASPSPPVGRNPFLVPTALPEPELEPGPETARPASPPGPPPGGRNPFTPLVGPTPSAADPTDQPTDPTTEQPAGAELLRRGSSGPEVSAVQQRLADRGWRIAVDGVFGPRTEAVVRAFQRRRDLAVDGVVGPRTRAALG